MTKEEFLYEEGWTEFLCAGNWIEKNSKHKGNYSGVSTNEAFKMATENKLKLDQQKTFDQENENHPLVKMRKQND